MSDDLLEDAIRAGVARGMDDAPVVPDLAERVRALPAAKRQWKLPAAAAAAVIVLTGVGLASYLPRTRSQDSAEIAAPSVSSGAHPGVHPPYGVPGTGGPTTEDDAVGAWGAVWLARYDGPLRSSELTIRHSEVDRYQIELKASCAMTGLKAQLSPTGIPSERNVVISVDPCPSPERYAQPASFGVYVSTFTRLAVSPDRRVLTLFTGSRPVMQWSKSPSEAGAGPDVRRWSVSGQLPDAALGTWAVVLPV